MMCSIALMLGLNCALIPHLEMGPLQMSSNYGEVILDLGCVVSSMSVSLQADGSLERGARHAYGQTHGSKCTWRWRHRWQ